MIWVEVTTEDVLANMPTDVHARYAQWLEDYPEKSHRLADLTANTLREFRDALTSSSASQVDPRETYLPQSAIRHCENIIIFTLAMEMGLELSSAASSARTSADVFLRQIPMGRWKATTEDTKPPTPRWVVPERSFTDGRALP